MVEPGSIREAGQSSELRLMIHDADGAMKTDFDVVHEEKVHLVIVRDGMDTFDHVHPTIDKTGRMVVSYTFPVGGACMRTTVRPANRRPPLPRS
jgi:hypothetical protein